MSNSRRIAQFVAGAMVLWSATGLAGAGKDGSRENEPGPVSALSADERRALYGGEMVTRSFAFERRGASYRAGISYYLVEAERPAVLSWLRQPGALEEALPHARAATLLAENDGISTIRMLHQRGPMQGRYTVRLAWDIQKGQARFWLDPARDNDLRDLWGYFQVRPVAPGVSLITFAFAFDLGGLAEILEPTVQAAVLDVPRRIAERVVPPVDEQVVGGGEERYD